jgi:hypothetical protein
MKTYNTKKVGRTVLPKSDYIFKSFTAIDLKIGAKCWKPETDSKPEISGKNDLKYPSLSRSKPEKWEH